MSAQDRTPNGPIPCERTESRPSEVIDVTLVGRFKHADLWAAAVKLGGQAALGERLGLTPQQIGRFVNFQDYPRTEERRNALEAPLHDLTGKLLDELWPEELRREIDARISRNEKDWGRIEATRPILVADLASLEAAGRMRALEAPTGPDPIEAAELREAITEAMRFLTARQQEVIKLRFGLNESGQIYTYEECGRIFKITKERVRQIEMTAIRKLQEHSELLAGWAPSSD